MKMKKDMMPHEKKAKMSVLEELQKQAADAMGGKLDGVKKVSVMAPSKEGMKEGLEKAEEILEGMPEGESEMPEMEEEHEMEDDMGCKTPEEVDQKIMKLLELKKQMTGKE